MTARSSKREIPSSVPVESVFSRAWVLRISISLLLNLIGVSAVVYVVGYYLLDLSLRGYDEVFRKLDADVTQLRSEIRNVDKEQAKNIDNVRTLVLRVALSNAEKDEVNKILDLLDRYSSTEAVDYISSTYHLSPVTSASILDMLEKEFSSSKRWESSDPDLGSTAPTNILPEPTNSTAPQVPPTEPRQLHPPDTSSSMGAAPFKASDITIATHEYTADWNPMSLVTYPARIVTQLTTERLFENPCLQEGSANLEPLCQTEYKVASGALQLELKKSCSISVEDVAYTLEQINRVPTNDYHAYNMTMQQNSDDLSWTLTSLNLHATAHVLTFPVLHRFGGNNLFSKPITSGDEARYNAATTGPARIERIGPDGVMLASRDNPSRKIYVNYYNRISELRHAMLSSEPPDIVLGMPPLIINPERYQQVYSSHLKNFVYVGFNFMTKDRDQRDLIESRQFRELIAQSFWTSDDFDNVFGVRPSSARDNEGIFLGQSLYAGNPVDILAVDQLRDRIKKFLRNGRINEFTLNLILAPFFSETFDLDELNNIERHLNALWRVSDQQNRFKIIHAANAASLQEMKLRNDFHLIVDIFYYGLFPLKSVAFMEADNPLNYLGINEISPRESQEYLRGEKSIVEFDELVRERYPVAVLGMLRFRDYFSSQLMKKIATKKQPICKSTWRSPLADLYRYMEGNDRDTANGSNLN